MSPVADNPVIVPDRDLGRERKPGESEPPRIRCPLCGWSPRKEDKCRLKFRLLCLCQRSPDTIFYGHNKRANRTDVRDCFDNCFGTRVWQRPWEVISKIFPLDQLESGTHSCDLQSR